MQCCSVLGVAVLTGSQSLLAGLQKAGYCHLLHAVVRRESELAVIERQAINMTAGAAACIESKRAVIE
jgi:hypothetical protein